jgi:hypothetical protein
LPFRVVAVPQQSAAEMLRPASLREYPAHFSCIPVGESPVPGSLTGESAFSHPAATVFLAGDSLLLQVPGQLCGKGLSKIAKDLYDPFERVGAGDEGSREATSVGRGGGGGADRDDGHRGRPRSAAPGLAESPCGGARRERDGGHPPRPDLAAECRGHVGLGEGSVRRHEAHARARGFESPAEDIASFLRPRKEDTKARERAPPRGRREESLRVVLPRDAVGREALPGGRASGGLADHPDLHPACPQGTGCRSGRIR